VLIVQEVDVTAITDSGKELVNGETQVSNLTKERQQILNYLGKVCSQYYSISGVA